MVVVVLGTVVVVVVDVLVEELDDGVEVLGVEVLEGLIKLSA